MAVLGYLLKLKGGLGLAFGAQFLHDFSTNNFLFNTLSTGKVSMPYLLSFPRYQTKCVKFLFRKLMMSQTIMADWEKKRGRWKYKN